MKFEGSEKYLPGKPFSSCFFAGRDFSAYLDTNQPDPDLLIRTEEREELAIFSGKLLIPSCGSLTLWLISP